MGPLFRPRRHLPENPNYGVYYMTDKLLYSLSIFLTGLGAGIALVAAIAPRSPKHGLLKAKIPAPVR